jgi:hypothetical protein
MYYIYYKIDDKEKQAMVPTSIKNNFKAIFSHVQMKCFVDTIQYRSGGR